MSQGSLITISSGTIFRAVLIGLLFWFLYFFHDLVLVLLTAVVIASSIEPLTKWFVKWKVPRVIAVLFIYLTIALFLVSIFYFFLPPLFADIVDLLYQLPEYFEELELENFGEEILGKSDVGSDPGSIFSLQNTIAGLGEKLFGVGGGVLQSISGIFGGIFSFILIIVISFYLAVQEKGIENFLRLIVPLKREKYIIHLWERSQKKIGLWMQGQLLLGVLVGVIVYLGLTILGVKYAFFLAVLSAIFEIIPVFGPVLAAIPAVALGFLEGPTLGLMVLGLYVILQQFENHLIYPLVVRKVVGVSPIVVILALVIGAKLAGFLGILLAVPVAAVLMEIAEDVQKEKSALTEKSGA